MRSVTTLSLGSWLLLTILLICSSRAVPIEDQVHKLENIVEYQTDYEKASSGFNQLTVELPANGDDATIQEDIIFNDEMDKALELLREVIRQNNFDRVPIPDFIERFTKKIGFIKVNGYFKGEKGSAVSTLSIARKGNAIIRYNGTAGGVEATLGLNKLEMQMRYAARLSAIRVSGDLDAKIHSNAINFYGLLDTTGGTCKIVLQKLQVTDLGKIEIHITGLGKLNWLMSKIVTWVGKRFNDKIRETIENKLRDLLQKQIGKIKCPMALQQRLFQPLV